MITDLNQCKEIAISFLYIEPKPMKEFPIFIDHPVFETSVLADSNMNMFNIFEEPDKYMALLKVYEQRIQKCSSVASLMGIIRKNYRIVYFKYIINYLSTQDYAEVLKEAYSTVETPANDVNVSMNELCKFFRDGDRSLLVNKSLPEELTVYRGVREDSPKYRKCISWTLSYEKACWFATRFSETGTVYECKVSRDAVLAYINDRNEEEVIIDISKLPKNIKSIQVNNGV